MNKLRHLAIIMDGNGRWAKNRGFIRTKGHEAGANVVETVAKFCQKEKIQNLTLYAFSTENWKRPKAEVEFLMNLLKKFLVNRREIFIKNGIKFRAIGDISVFDDELKGEIKNLEDLTRDFNSLNFNLALNYGAKDEIVRACNKIIEKGETISEETIGQNLDEISDVDLLIRTGGEHRISNFLLWQISYAELFFTPTFWPDFSEAELGEIVSKFRDKNRRFGGL